MEKEKKRGNARLSEEIDKRKPWFHNLHLPGNIQTAPSHFLGDFPRFKWNQFKDHFPEDLNGYSVLDIGCNAGFYSFALAERGAEVTGIDLDPHYLKQAEWAAGILNLEHKVKFLQMQVYDLVKIKEQFDIVLFMGVFYHLRYPLLALDIVSQKVKQKLVFQTFMIPGKEEYSQQDVPFSDRSVLTERGWPSMAFIEQKLAGDPTNWWVANHAAVNAMLRTCGMEVTAMPGHEIYIAEKNASMVAVAEHWNRSEFLSATGREWQHEVNGKLRQ